MTATGIKFCGMTRGQDVDLAVRLGVQAIGFVLVRSSPRFISPGLAAIIRRRLPETVRAVALLRDPAESEVQEALDVLKPDLLQFHGNESPGFCGQFGLPYWRAVAMGGAPDLADLERRFAGAEALLLDAHAPGRDGGTGQRFDWSRVPPLQRPVVLAGGLTPDNVAEAIRTVRPAMVDVSSGIEAAPGIKDPARMEQFVKQVRSADER